MTSLDSRAELGYVVTGPDSWVDVIAADRLDAEVGVPALVNGEAVAVFRIHDGTVFAVSNNDPTTGASVIARGIVGSRGDAPTVASPLYKHVFDLRTGVCLDDDALSLTLYHTRVHDGVIQVRKAGAGG
ncbi:MAG: nitrite reductase small subunit NirD [Sporichthyaceae bacterium]